jgi:hypothetical protein
MNFFVRPAGAIFAQPGLPSFRKNRYTGGQWQKAPRTQGSSFKRSPDFDNAVS